MIVVSLFDESGNMVRPWAEAGHTCYCFDLLNGYEFEVVGSKGGVIHYEHADLFLEKYVNRIIGLKPDIIFGFPPCTDLAVSGARHFEAKRRADPEFQDKAMALVMRVPEIAYACDAPWMFENPVSMVASLYRKPDYSFHPWEYGGYLPEDDIHPRWPSYILPRDAYTKLTCIWAGNGFRMPPKRPVPAAMVNGGNTYSVQFHKLGGKSDKTKQIRSETPRGFARAVLLANETVFEY